ncbi:MAG TPA: hypothetical protein DGX96_05385 [Lachnospiraceae bacterium]|jgi:thiamine phosphate synthase YjbQ (UPF0047 family)|nr:hypothetical protein [Lachnospiraceae bacterium]
MIVQEEVTIRPQGPGFHLITPEVLKAVPKLPEKGIMNVFCKNTSTGLAILDSEKTEVLKVVYGAIGKMLPTMVGSFYIPSIIESVITGVTLTIPITDGRLDMSEYQDIFIAEYHKTRYLKTIVVTVYSEDSTDNTEKAQENCKTNIVSLWKRLKDYLLRPRDILPTGQVQLA